MLPFLAKVMIPIATIFITAVGVFQGIDYIKGKLKKKDQAEEDNDGYV